MTRTRSLCAALALGLALAHLPTGPLAAQVGIAPGASPFRDITYGNGWTFTAGKVYGDGGSVRMSPNSGSSFALRYDVRFSGLLQGYAELGRMSLERQVMHRDDSVANRFSGPFDMTVWTPQVGIQINLTGPKRWRGLAPFIAGSLGAAVGEEIAQDTSNFLFGSKLVFVPSAGLRAYVGDRLHVRLEGQMYYWKMKYPSVWLSEPDAQPSGSGEPTTAPIATADGLSEWLWTPSLRLGIGLAF
jgi:hypothetical protein